MAAHERMLFAHDAQLTPSGKWARASGKDMIGYATLAPCLQLTRSLTVAKSAAGLLLIMAMVFGGAGKGGGDAIVHASAVLVLGLAILRWRSIRPGPAQRYLFFVLVTGVVVAILQLVPLPQEIFSSLPHRATVLAELHSAGLDPQWLPMTLDRWGTVRAMLALLSFGAMWMLCATLPLAHRVELLKLAVIVAVPMALMGFAQASIKRDTTGATAWFENRNHFATMMAMLIPFAFAAAQQRQPRVALGVRIAWLAAAVGLLLAAALSFSRVGFLLAGLSAVAAVIALRRPDDTGFASNRSAWIAMAIAASAIGYFASGRLIARFQSDLVADLRWQYFETGWSALGSYWPWGSGLGSFKAVYAPFEPLQSMGEFTYANYAHNEWLQNGIEGGLPALALMAILTAIVSVAAFRALNDRSAAALWSRAAAIAALVPLFHSLFDYPLRTLSCSILLALVLSVLVRRTGRTGDPPRQSEAQVLR